MRRAGRDRMRVAFVTPSFAGGGAERVLVNLAAALHNDTCTCHLVALSAEGPLRARIPEDLDVIDLGVPRIRAALPRLLQTLRRIRPDVILASAPHLNVALLAARPLLPRGVAVVVREPNLPSLHLRDLPYPAVFRASYRRLYPHADLVIASSQRMANEMLGFGVPARKVAVVANPVALEQVRAAAVAPQREPGDGRRCVAVGRLVHQKGFDRLVAAMAELDAADRLRILGDGPLREPLERTARRITDGEQVTFAGFVDNPWEWVAGADRLVLPSRTEGMPNVALEALACGTPVIATPQAGGLAEVRRQAPAGSVEIVPADRLAEALRRVTPEPVQACRPSRLPATFRAEQVEERMRHLLGGLVS